MPPAFSPKALDVAAFAAAQGELQGSDALDAFPRLAQECHADAGPVRVQWQARGLSLTLPAAGPRPGLHLQAQASVPLVCQMCLSPTLTPLTVDRRLAFAADETSAERLDSAEDLPDDLDVLALPERANLHELLEDELLMALPLTPRHDGPCPQRLPMQAQSAGFDDASARRNPFAELARLKSDLRKP